jgi:hypothetical protein
VRNVTEIVWTKKEAVKKREAEQSSHPDSKSAATPQ